MLSGCATGLYYPPEPLTPPPVKNDATTNKSFDTAWSTLIDHASSNFFSIDNFEKASGLITLSFSAADAGKYIDCGRMTAEAMGRKIDEPYADYMANRNGARLTGKMNIVVKSLGPTTTQIKVNTRYVFTAPATARSQANTWAFDTGGESTIVVSSPLANTAPTRTCRPTHVIEKSIIDAILK